DLPLGALRAVFVPGSRVPAGVSFIGFDDIGFAQYTTPRLTTVKRPIEQISIKGAENLLSLIENPGKNGKRIFVNTYVMIRDG
ncbi:substrate-binding domain-containing protein, partial [Peribacillus frigoritolerans]|uniref:substrate-binding domain-containing protein n=1 Tax=Peribacillus frigoritolerans TaxID=450367 RepID=UPI0020BF8383